MARASRPFARILGLVPFAALLTFGFAPVAAAHPVILDCGQPIGYQAVYPLAYVSGFDPLNPNTWQNGIVTLGTGGNACGGYPGVCFYDPGMPGGESACNDPHHPIHLPYCGPSCICFPCGSAPPAARP